MKKHLIRLFSTLAFLGFAAPSWGGVIPLSFTVTPDSIVTGDTAHLDLQIELSADSGFFNPNFASGSVTLFSNYSGIGPPLTFVTSTTAAVGSGGTFREFTADFTYSTSGLYFPNFLVEASYTEQFTTPGVIIGTFKDFRGSIRPIFGPPITHTSSFNSIFNEGISLLVTDPVVNSFDVAAAAPEPAIWVMMLIGFAAVGFAANHRKKKSSAIAAT